MNTFTRFHFFLVALITLSIAAVADVTVLGSGSGLDEADDSSFSFTVSVPAGTQLAVVGVTNRNARNATSVLIGTSTMTFAINSISSPNSDMDERTQLYYLVNPPAGSQTVSVTLSGNTRHKAAGCLLLAGVNTAALATTTKKADENQFDNDPTPSISFTAAEAPSGSMVVSAIHARGADLTIAGTGHTERWNLETYYFWDAPQRSSHGGGTIPGSSSTGATVAWTPDAGVYDANWGMAAMVIPASYSGIANITPDTLSVNDNDPNDTVFGTLTATDADNKPPYVWSLINNAGGRFALNTSTSLDIDVRIANAALIDYGQNPSHTIRVGARNNVYPVVFEKDITINVMDTTDPVIGSVTASQPFARSGEFVTFSATITDNDTIAGTPTMTLGGSPLMFSNQTGDVYTWGWNVPLEYPDGPVSVTVTAVDTAGNETTLVADDVSIVDNMKPYITGLIVSQMYAKEGDTVSIQVEVQDFYGVAEFPTVTLAGIDCGIPSVSGFTYTWLVGITSAFPEGPADVLVTALDLAGNQSQGSGPALLTIDRTPPTISAFASTHQYATLNNTVTLQAAVLDNFGLNGTPTLYLNGTMMNVPTISGNTYYWQFQITPALTQGAAVIAVEAIDRAGNEASGSPASTILVVDYTQPSISALTVTPSRAKGGTPLTLTAQVVENYGLNGTPTMNINGLPVPPPSHSGSTYTWNYIVPTTPPPAEGPAEIEILAVDLAGNFNNLLNTSQLTYDPNAPIFSNAEAVPNLARLGQTATITVNVYDSSPFSGTPSLTVNGVSATYIGVEDLGGNNKILTFSFIIAAGTPEGDADLQFSAADILGNARTTSFNDVLMVDKTAPVISDVSASPSVSRAGGTVNITFDAIDAFSAIYGTPTVTVNGASASYQSVSGGHYTYRYTVRDASLDPNGPATIFITCRDTIGNSGSVQYDDKLMIDNSLPMLSDLVVFPNIAAEGTSVTIGFNASDDSGLGSLPEVKINGIPAAFVAAQGSTFEYRYTVRAAYDDEGYALLYIRIEDSIGNVLLSESTGLLLVDFSPPYGSLFINDNDTMTRITDVMLSIETSDGSLGSGAQSMSLSDDGINWSAWEPIAASREWQLKSGQGYKTIYIRLRDRAGNVSMLPITDTIALKPNSLIVDREGSGDIKAFLGDAIVLEVVPRNIFGAIQSYEWFKDGLAIEGLGPVLAIDNFEETDMGSYVCRVADEVEIAESLPFQVGISEETPVPVASWRVLVLLIAVMIFTAGALLMRTRRSFATLLLFSGFVLLLPGIAVAEVTVVYSARAELPMDLSDEAMTDLALEQGSIEIWTRLENGEVKRQLSRLGESGVANPGFSSFQREGFSEELSKGLPLTVLKDGTEELHIPLSDEAVRVYSQNLNKGVDEPSFEMKIIVDGKPLVSEKRYETFVDGVMRPDILRLDYPGGAIIQIFEYTNTPPAPLPPVYLRKVGVDDDAKSDVYPKSWVTKDAGDVQTREVQFIVPPQGLGNLGFDSGWVPGGSGPDPGGFIIQVRLNAQAGYTYDAAVNGTFNLYPFESYSELGIGPATGNWGFYFGAEFFMKAAFDIPPILGFDLEPFIVDIPYVPDFNMVASDRDYFNSWLLDSESTVRDDAARTNVVNLEIISLLITQGVIPELPDWVPLPKVGVSLDVGAIADGHLSCDNITLSDGTQYLNEGQQIWVYVPPTGYHAIAEYVENAELNLGVKLYPSVYFSWDLYVFDFSYRWPTDFDDPDNLLARLEWLPIMHDNFPFTNAELNFTGQPSTLPANDWFTELFVPVLRTTDITNHQVRFTPNLSNNFYSACVGTASAYRTDPAGGTTVTLGDDTFVEVALTEGKQVPLYGVYYDSFYIGSNGYITFNTGDTTSESNHENHFNQPRISGLFLNMNPAEGGTISYKQLPNRVVVTYDHVRLANIITEQTANFQIEMFFDGRIVITWLQEDTYVGLIGLSRGEGVPEEFEDSDFTQYPGCLTPIAPEYGVRVNFVPPEVLPYEPRWRANSGEWLPTGTYISVPLGENWVYFNYLPLYWTAPGAILTQVNTPDVFVDLYPEWIRSTGTVTVSTQPELVSWVVTDIEGGVHSGTGPAVLENIPTGMTTIEWQPLATYQTPDPATQEAMLYSGMTIDFSANYPPIIGQGEATVIVTIQPEAALAAGAQWRVNGGAWFDSGYVATVPDGDTLIEFKELPGWTRPVAIALFLNRNTTTTFNRGYGRQKGTVWVVTEPPNAPWELTDGDGVMQFGIGEQVLQNIPTGDNLQVSWGGVLTYTPPIPNPTVFSLAQNEVKRIVGAYVPVIGVGEGIVSVTLYPPAVANAGAQWRLFGDEWRVSGGMVASRDGEQIILFSDVPGWITPEDMTVNVVRDVTNYFDATYVRLSGTVMVDVTPDNAYWTLTDSDGGTYTRIGDATLTEVPSGEVSITWGELEGYEPPQPNPASYTLEADATLNIAGNYIESILTAGFSAFPLTGPPPLTVTFHDESESTTKDIIEWRWYFGDGKVGTEQHPTHVYRDPGSYTVTLTVVTYDKMDVLSKKQYITVTEGLPATGFMGLSIAVALIAICGSLAKRKRRN